MANNHDALVALLGQHWQKLVALLIWALLLSLYFWYAAVNNLGPVAVLVRLVALMHHHLYGPLIFGLIYTFRPLIFFSAGLMSMAGGYLFGPVFGLVYTLLASNLSATLAYCVGRYLGQGVVDPSSKLMQRYTDRLHQNSFETVLLMRLVLLPYDFVNYLCGFLRIHYQPYITASVLGSFPVTLALVLFGSSVEDIDRLLKEGKLPSLDWRILLTSGVILGGSLVLSRYFKRREAI